MAFRITDRAGGPATDLGAPARSGPLVIRRPRAGQNGLAGFAGK
jgi:hypothetical protein